MLWRLWWSTSGDGGVGGAVVNRAARIGVFQRYPRASLPYHITWRQLGSGTYVVAMEPSTNRDAGRFDARSRGELQHLAPGEQRRYQLEIGALLGHEAIDAFTAHVAELRAFRSRTPGATTTTAGGRT